MTSAGTTRRETDLRKLRELCNSSSGKLAVKATKGSPIDEITVELNLKTAPSSGYPAEVQTTTIVAIQLSSRYPLQEPTANIRTPIYHPNVYLSGKICFGQKWLPSEGLDLLVKRIVQIVTYDPAILNPASPANGAALHWYNQAIKAHPTAFPTDRLILVPKKEDKPIIWTNR